MLTTTQSYVTYQGNNVTTVFPFNFLIQQAGHLVVSITDNTQTPPVITVLASSQYSVEGIANPTGGTVTYGTASPLPYGWSITIQRVVPYQQSTSLTNQGAFYPQVVEAALDNLTMQTQQIAAQIATGQNVTPQPLILMDTTNGHTYQLQIVNGILETEQIS